MPSSTRRRALCVAAAVLIGGCLSPTLPMPPPDRPTIEGPDENGNTRLTGEVESGASVYAINRTTNRGTFQITGDSGAYDLTLITEIGHGIVMWYTVGGEQSERLQFEIRAPSSPPPP